VKAKVVGDSRGERRPDRAAFLAQIVVDSLCLHGVIDDAVTIDRVLAAHRDLEDVGATVDDAEAVLVVGAGDVRDGDVERAVSVPFPVASEPLGLAADAVYATGALFEGGRVPRQVVMNDVTAFAVQVETTWSRTPAFV
jgi:hypothetical protein